MDANYILQNATDLRFTLTTTLDNTLTQAWGFEDMNAGAYGAASGSRFDGIEYESNAAVAISNKAALNSPSHEVVSGGLTLTQELKGRFNSSETSSFGTITLFNTKTSDEFSLRSWKGKTFSLKVGGTIDGGNDLEQTLTFDEYETWFDGVVSDFTVNQNSIDLALNQEPSDLRAMLPLNSFQSGDSKGAAIPYILGAVKGFSPPSVGGGLFKFHDGVVATGDDIADEHLADDAPFESGFNNFSAISIGEGLDYYHELEFNTGVSGTGVLTDTYGAVWTQDSATQLSESVIDNISVTSDGGLHLSSSDNIIKVTNGNGVDNNYSSSDFDWAIVGNGFESNKGLVSSVALTGDVEVDSVGGRWFKIKADGTGSVTFTLGENVGEFVVNIRSIRGGAQQTVDNFSITPDSITPALGAGRGVTSVVTFNSLDSKTLSFDYTSNSDALLAHIWIESAETYTPARGNVNFEFDSALTAHSVTNTTGNSSQSILQNGLDGRALGFDVVVGSGEVAINLASASLFSESKGIQYTTGADSIFFSPPSSGGEAGLARSFVQSEFIPIGRSNGDSTNWRLQLRARIKSDTVTSALATSFQSGLVYDTFTVDEAWREYEFDNFGGVYGLTNLKTFLQIGTWRGTLPTNKGVGTEYINPDEDFSMEVDYIRAYPIDDNSSTIRVYIPSQDKRTELPCYRVESAQKYKNKLPNTVAVYDAYGNVCVAPEYSTIVMDCNGGETSIDLLDAASKMTTLAANRDAIDTTLAASPNVGYVLNTQKPSIEHIADVLFNTDYFYKENLSDNNITIERRYDANTYPADFTLEESQIIGGSVRRVGSEDREQQYIVEYNKDHTDNKLSSRVKSSFGYLSDLDALEMSTALTEESEADIVASRISRDSAANGVYNQSAVGVGLGFAVDDAGVVTHPDIPKNRPSIIQTITQSIDNNETIIKTKVLLES